MGLSLRVLENDSLGPAGRFGRGLLEAVGSWGYGNETAQNPKASEPSGSMLGLSGGAYNLGLSDSGFWWSRRGLGLRAVEFTVLAVLGIWGFGFSGFGFGASRFFGR